MKRRTHRALSGIAAAFVGLTQLTKTAGSAPPTEEKAKPRPDLVLADDDCRSIGGSPGDKNVRSRADEKRTTLCFRRSQDLFECIATLEGGATFPDGKEWRPMSLHVTTEFEAPRMLLASPETNTLVIIDSSQRRYIWNTGKLVSAGGPALIQTTCVGNTFTKADLEKAGK